MSQTKLTVINIDNYSQNFGNSGYAMFLCETESNQSVTVGVSHTALTASGISLNYLDPLIGSNIIVRDTVNRRTGEMNAVTERIQGIVDGTILSKSGDGPGIALVGKGNCSIVKSAGYVDEMKDRDQGIASRVQVLKEKEKNATRLANQLAEKARLKLAQAGIVVAPKATTVEPIAELEVNTEDIPF